MKASVVLCCSAAILTMFSQNAFTWGQKGHDVTCAIAQNHLDWRTARKINEIFDGKSLVYWANWMDNASNTPAYAYTKTWHYKNVDADETYQTAAKCETGDVITAINSQIEALKSGTLNKEQTATALKILIHCVGDLHCPMHMGHKTDLGGNKCQVQYFGSGKNLHSVWDSGVIESGHNWTYTEWVNEIDRADRRTVARLSSGTPDDWAEATCHVAEKIYEATPSGSKLSYDYVAEWTPVIEQQLLLGGLHLAAILNDIF